MLNCPDKGCPGQQVASDMLTMVEFQTKSNNQGNLQRLSKEYSNLRCRDCIRLQRPTDACFPCTEKKGASKRWYSMSFPKRPGVPCSPTGQRLSFSVTMSVPDTRFSQNPVGLSDSGNLHALSSLRYYFDPLHDLLLQGRLM